MPPTGSDKPFVIRFDDEAHKYWIDGVPVPSVTQVLGVLPKEALTWWGFRVGLSSALKLIQDGDVTWGALLAEDYRETLNNAPSAERANYFPNDKKRKKPRSLLEHWCIRRRLHPNAIKDDAATRGTSIHEALVQLGLGEMPDVHGPESIFPFEDRPYVQALVRWWMDHEPEFLHQEQIVGSKVHMFAGRFDIVVRERNGDEVMVDLKTGKGVYPDTHFRQMAGYEIAWMEMGGRPFDAKKILNARADGTYVYTPPVKVDHDHFLSCLRQLRSMQDFDRLQKGEPRDHESLEEAA